MVGRQLSQKEEKQKEDKEIEKFLQSKDLNFKASLDIQGYRYLVRRSNDSLGPYNYKNTGDPMEPIEVLNEDVEPNSSKKKKDFAELNTDEILNLLKKAYSSRKHRKVSSKTKIDRSLTLKKESHTILIELSEQLIATPKKIVESLIQGVNLESKSELLKISSNISGRRTTNIQSSQEEHVEPEEAITEPESTVVPEPLEVKNIMKKKSNKIENRRKNTKSEWDSRREYLTSGRGPRRY